MAAPFAHLIRVRYAECDPQGIVFNAHYFAYFDIAMTELWRAAFGGYELMMQRGIDMVVVDAGATFRASGRFDDELSLEVTVERLGTTSMATRHEILRSGELLVEGTMHHVFVDRETMAKTEIPDWLRDGLAPYARAPSAGGPAESAPGATDAAGAAGAAHPAP